MDFLKQRKLYELSQNAKCVADLKKINKKLEELCATVLEIISSKLANKRR